MFNRTAAKQDATKRREERGMVLLHKKEKRGRRQEQISSAEDQFRISVQPIQSPPMKSLEAGSRHQVKSRVRDAEGLLNPAGL